VRYTRGGARRRGEGRPGPPSVQSSSLRSGLKPSSHSLLVVLPRSTENSFQLPFFPTDKEIYQGNVNRGSEKRRWRPEEQRRSEEDEHVSAEIERIPRKTIRAGRDQRF
jgi:hypothetical protein